MKTELTDGTITVRRTRESDAAAFYEGINESRADLTPWMPWYHENYSLADTEAWLATRGEAWEKGAEYNLAIIETATGVFLGGAGVSKISAAHGRCEIGYWVRSSRAGRGIAAAAAILAARFAFDELGLSRVCITIAVENARSRKVAEKTGATFEGVLRSYYVLLGVRHDAAVYSLLASEFKT